MRYPCAACAVALAACATAPPDMNAPASLAAAETAFAAHSMRENMRPAFMAHFAEDGVTVGAQGWRPSTAFLATRPDPPIALDWRPVYVEVARSGELGVSTGPSRMTSVAKPGDTPRFGQYISVWRRQGNAAWKVEVDIGISHPGPALWDQPLEARTVEPSAGALQDSQGLRQAEERFARESAGSGARAAYAALASERLRFYRNDAPPALGKAAALRAPGMDTQRMSWRVERLEKARSGDLGYARGSYASADAPSQVLGHFLRVWRVEDGAWRVAVDVTNAVPASQ